MVWRRVVEYRTHKVLKINKILRSFILPQFRKITPQLHQIFGCDICIIPKDMHIDLNGFITRPVTYLQQNSVGRHM